MLLKDTFGEQIKSSGSEDAYAMMQAGADRIALPGLVVGQLWVL